MKLCFATNNKGKINEIDALLKKSFEIVSLKEIGCMEDLPETHETFEENSAEKALYVFNKYHVNCFADDSGLEVDALHGAPGVYSARYAGKHGDDNANIDLLLKNMQGIANRKARFKAVITLVINGDTRYFEGSVEGQITNQRIGDAGFGYDPVFIPDGYDKTFALFSLEEKNEISHRGKAVNQLVRYLSKEFYS